MFSPRPTSVWASCMNTHFYRKTGAVPHALDMHRAIDGLMRGFDLTGFDAFVVDRELNVVRANCGAGLAEPVLFHIRGGKLRTVLPEQQQKLEMLAATSARMSAGSAAHSMPFVLLDRSKLLVKGAAVNKGAMHHEPPLVALWFKANGKLRRIAPEAIQQIFSLTPAESRLASELTGGASLITASGNIGITLNTARDRLKSIFAKTQTRRQAELIGLLSQIS